MRARDILPGINVEVAPQQARTTLPRMDVAVFAGFTQRGPCHVPIAISSVAQFETVFGGGCRLAIDHQTGIPLRANLPASVRSFFANGGRRCWVIRIAATTELAQLLEAQGVATADLRPATAGLFAMPGLLCRMPSLTGDSSLVAPATLAAASLGSWSDSLRLAARVSRRPFKIGGLTRVRWGLCFQDHGTVVPGDVIELQGRSGLTKRYAKIVRAAGGEVFACWIASLLRISKPTPAKTGHVAISGDDGVYAATFHEGSTSQIVAPGADALLKPGRWAHFFQQGEAIWLRIDSVDGATASGPAWQQVGSRLPATPCSAAIVTVDLREYLPSGDRTHACLALAPERHDSVQSILDADRFHADSANHSAAIRPAFAVTRDESERIALGYGLAGQPSGFAAIAGRFGTSAASVWDRIALRSAWLPIGLTESFAEPVAATPTSLDPLVRDGLAVADERVFLDPRLALADYRTLAERAEAILQVEESPLFGIHSALAAAGDLFPEPSLLAVPDAAQPDWAEAGTKTPPKAIPGAAAQPSWTNHTGGCAAEPARTGLAGPDESRFLDCSTKLLPKPQLTALDDAVAPNTSFPLSWSAGPPGSVFILEESARPDFIPAAEILRGEGTSTTIAGKRVGLFYYRLRTEHDGNVSAWASAKVVVRGSRFVVTDVNPERTRRLHAAMLRLAGGTGQFFAILTMPRQCRAAGAVEHARLLRTLAPGSGGRARLGQDEGRLLSFGALCHPWLVTGSEDGPVSISPDGAVAGVIARRTIESGAWIAPANQVIQGVFGLDTTSPAAERLELDRGRVNMIRKLGSGFALEDSLTLSDEPDWGEINVRRLMILLRRYVVERGMTYLFEPNGPVLRRAVERDLGTALDHLQARGAFAGRSSAQSFRIAVSEEAGDLDAGRLIVELGVAPARPMAFVTVRLVCRGDGISVVEEA